MCWCVYTYGWSDYYVSGCITETILGIKNVIWEMKSEKEWVVRNYRSFAEGNVSLNLEKK